MNRIVVLLALVAVLVLSFNIAFPAAYACDSGSHPNPDHVVVQIRGTGLLNNAPSTGNAWKVQVFAGGMDHKVDSVKFVLSVWMDSHPISPGHQGAIPVGSWTQIATVQHGSAQATFFATYKGKGYYLFVLNAYDATKGTFLGTAWVDPQGTAG